MALAALSLSALVAAPAAAQPTPQPADRPLLLAGGVGFARWQYAQTWTSGSKSPRLLDAFSAPNFELLAEYGAEQWGLWIWFEAGQKDPYTGVLFDLAGDWLLYAWDGGSVGVGPELALRVHSLKQERTVSEKILDDAYRFTDALVLIGGELRADHWFTRSFRTELRLAPLGIPIYAARTYEGGIAGPGADPPRTLPLERVFSMLGDLLLEFSLGGSLEVLFVAHGELATYGSSAITYSGTWASQVFALNYSLRLLFGGRF